jgi:hypothetical protein
MRFAIQMGFAIKDEMLFDGGLRARLRSLPNAAGRSTPGPKA